MSDEREPGAPAPKPKEPKYDALYCECGMRSPVLASHHAVRFTCSGCYSHPRAVTRLTPAAPH